MPISDSEIDELMSDSQTQQQSLLQPLHASTSSAAPTRGQQRRTQPSKSPRSSASSSSSEDDGFAASAEEDLDKYVAEQEDKEKNKGKRARPKKKQLTPAEKTAMREKLCKLLDPKQETMDYHWALEVATRSEEAFRRKTIKRSDADQHGLALPGSSAQNNPLGDNILPDAALRPLPAPTSAGLNGAVVSDSEEEMLGPSVRRLASTSLNNASSSRTAPAILSDSEEEMLGPSLRCVASNAPPQKAQAVINDDSEEEMLSLPRRPSLAANGTSSSEAGTSSITAFAPSLSATNTVNPRPPFLSTAEQDLIGPLVLDKAAGIMVPACINRFLRDYQRRGVQFLFDAYREGRGAILADDMGLGKTVQVAAFLAAVMRKNGGNCDRRRRAKDIDAGRMSSKDPADAVWPTCLILVPQSLLGNWDRELQTWGYFEHAIYAPDHARAAPLASFKRGFLDIILCSHEYASGHIEELKDLAWTCIFADEAHKFKNPNTKMTKAMNLFACKRRFAMTGTVIQNRSEEMWTILDWTNPGLFGDLNTWELLVAMPLKLGQRTTASGLELDTFNVVARALTRTLLPRFMIRRTKTLVAKDLPAKHEKIVFCPLTNVQRDAYKRLLADPIVVAMRNANKPCPCGRKDGDGLPFKLKNCCDRNVMGPYLSTLFLLQCLANHAALFFPTPKDQDHHQKEVRERYKKQVEYCQRIFPDDWETKQCNDKTGLDERLCGKWLALRELLGTWKEAGDKVLIFSRSLRLLTWIEKWVDRVGHKSLRLDGKTPSSRRQSLVEEFNRDDSIFCFLISTNAGGVGLNLVGANKVVVVDPNWSPAMDAQAIDRAYRIGQTRPVTVFRLIGAGTIEELIYGRQVYKTQTANVSYGNRLAGEGPRNDAKDGGEHGATGNGDDIDDDDDGVPREHRFFEGVERVEKHTGELFGIGNLFSFQEKSIMSKIFSARDNVRDANPDAAGHGAEIEEIARNLEDGAKIEGGTGRAVRRALAAGPDEDRLDDEFEREEGVEDVPRRASGGGSRPSRRRSGAGASASASPEDDRETAGLRRVGVRQMHDHGRLFDHSSDGDGDDEGAGSGSRSAGRPQAKKRKTQTAPRRASGPRQQSQSQAQLQPQQPAAQWPPPRKPSGQQPQAQTNGVAASTSAQA